MTKAPCQHIWSAHQHCQWCHRERKDIDYEDGLRDARDLLLIVSPNVTPMESLSGIVSQLSNYIAGLRADRDERAVHNHQFFSAMEALKDENHAMRNEVASVLMLLDELAELWATRGSTERAEIGLEIWCQNECWATEDVVAVP